MQNRAREHGIIRGGMAITLAFIHTGHVLIPVFGQLAKEHLPDMNVFHMLDESMTLHAELEGILGGRAHTTYHARRPLGMLDTFL